MDFGLSDDQKLLLTSFEGLLERYRQVPHGTRYVAFSEAFQADLVESGYLDIISQPGFGVLDAALLIEAAATCPLSAEIAAGSLIQPLLGKLSVPTALCWQASGSVRYLPTAVSVCAFRQDGVVVGKVTRDMVESLESVVAYPMGRLTKMPEDGFHYKGKMATAIRRRALIGIAAEAAGAMRGALEHTVRYVKERQQFGQPLGHFQAIQHRLAEDAQLVRACRWLAFRAAYNDDDAQAAVACLYVQDAIRKVINDCHQFCGAMGLTLEFPLHLWTYRLKVLQGEAGGRATQAQLVARQQWGGTASQNAVA